MERTVAIVYQTTKLEEAQLSVALVERSQADLLVRRVDSIGQAQGDALWYITHDRQSATVIVRFTSQNTAQVKVCLVDGDGEEGWQGRRPRNIHL